MRPALVRFLLVLCLLAFPLSAALMCVAWGHFPGFFLHPARVVAAGAFAAAQTAVIMLTSGYRKGVRGAQDDLAWRMVMNLYGPLLFLALPFGDGHGIACLPGGDALREAGMVLLLAGLVFRIGPMLELGTRFSGHLTIQEDHHLQTSGFYAWVRHPSYLGVVLMHLGFTGVFRSGVGLAFLPVLATLLWRRTAVEERLLAEEFGDEFRVYASRTSRIVPGLP